MKILQVCNKVPFPLKDGGVLAIHNLTKGFSTAGADVTILTMNTIKHRVDERHVKSYFDTFKNVRVVLVNINANPNFINALKNLLFSKLPFTADRFISKNFRKKLEMILKNENFDIVQLEGLYLMPYTSVIRKNSNASIALRAHNVEHEIWQRNVLTQQNLLRKIFLSIVAKRLEKFEFHYINKYDFLVPITQCDANKFDEMGNTRPVFVCPYAYQSNNLGNPDIQNKPDSFFYIGSLDWIPNQQGLTWFVQNVWSRISEEIKSAKFYIAGRNAPAWLEEFLRMPGIMFLGEVENAGTFMKDKSIMIVPLFSGSGMRVKIVEAMAAGKVVITTHVGAEGIDLTHNKNVLIADTVIDFLTATKYIYSNADIYLQMAKNAVNFVRSQLNNTEIVLKLLDFYRSKTS